MPTKKKEKKEEEKKEERNDVKKWEQINQLNELERSAAGLLQLSGDMTESPILRYLRHSFK